MADTGNYPQLPRNVWRGAWDAIRKSPRRKLDDRALAAELGVQMTAAKAYARELAKIGILDTDFLPTPLANQWRQDGDDPEVIEEILGISYPSDLLELAPRGDADRDKVVRWFMNEGLGEGAAKNKAATYLMIASGMPNDLEQKPPAIRKKGAKPEGRQTNPPSQTQTKSTTRTSSGSLGEQPKPTLNVNVQIHISADASTTQINAIFSAMRKYFNESD